MSPLHRASVILVAAVLVGAAGCAGGDRGAVSSADHVRVVVLPYLNFVPFHIAAEEGLFAAHGLDVEFIKLPRNQDIMASLATGQVDVAGGMVTVNELSLAAGGARVRMVADLGRLAPGHCTFTAFLTRRELLESGALQDPDRIRELVFDADLLIPWGYFIDELLRPTGLTVDDLNIVNVPPVATMDALAKGSVDVTIDSEPFLTFHRANEDTVVLARGEDLVPNFIITMLMYGPTMLDERPEVGERFATAMLEAIRVYREGKTPRNLEIAELGTGLTEEQLSQACWPEIPADGRFDPAQLRGYQEWNVAHGYVDRVLAADELFDQRFIDAANAAMAR
jgi:NitT/TauT family transport system substrate-binding protein